MLVLGIILLILVAVAVAGVIANGSSQEVAFNTSVVDVTTHPVWVFLAGAVAMLVTLIGLSFIRRGTRRRVERRREMKRLRKVEQEHVSGPIPVTGSDTRTATPPDDQPDRQLVREQAAEPTRRTSAASSPESVSSSESSTASSPEPGRQSVATGTTEAAPATEDPARHREP